MTPAPYDASRDGTWWLDQQPVSCRLEKLIPLAIAKRVDRYGFANPTIELIASEALTDRGTCSRTLTQLIGRNLLDVPDRRGGRGRANVYRLQNFAPLRNQARSHDHAEAATPGYPS